MTRSEAWRKSAFSGSAAPGGQSPRRQRTFSSPPARNDSTSRAIDPRVAPMQVRCARTGTPHDFCRCSAMASVFAPVEPPAAP